MVYLSVISSKKSTPLERKYVMKNFFQELKLAQILRKFFAKAQPCKRWYVEVLSRDSKEEIEIPAEFDSELELIDNDFVENLFAKKIAYRKSREDNSKENEFIDSYLESYLKAWENYLDSRETRST